MCLELRPSSHSVFLEKGVTRGTALLAPLFSLTVVDAAVDGSVPH